MRLESQTKEVESLRKKQKEDTEKHREEVTVLRKESMRVRQLE